MQRNILHIKKETGLVVTWIALENTGLSEIGPAEMDKRHMSALWKEAAKIIELIGVRYMMADQRLRGRKWTVVVQWMLPYMFSVPPDLVHHLVSFNIDTQLHFCSLIQFLE